MRKKYFIITAILIFYSLNMAQFVDRNKSPKDIVIRVKGGLNLATIRGKYIENPEYNKGVIFGFSQSGQMNSLFNSQIELLFSMKGSTFSYKNELDEKMEIFYNLYYLELPLMIKFRLIKDNHAKSFSKLFICLGVTMGFNVLAEVDDEEVGEIVDIASEINNPEFGIVAGLSFERILKNQRILSVEFRYNIGFSNILEKADLEYYNEVYSVMLGFDLFNIKRSK